MLVREGYKMFYGTMKINPINADSFMIKDVWLYKPEYDCWYGAGRSFSSNICEVIDDLSITPSI